ncbi:hypothetical protein HDU99_002637 [Rhizoclosmatium hyalinum]|nr:hypothetical protein HDU99_002637 [Rhizoclosmatium hyalinum]
MDNETVKEEANDDIYSTMSQNDYRDVDAVSESSISSISAYSSDEMESEHPKEKEEYEYEAYYGQEQQFDDEKKELDDRDCKLEMLGAVNQFEHAAQPIPYSCYYQPNVSTLPPLPLQQQYVSSAPSYFSSSDFAAIPPPNYPFSYDTKADSQAIHDMKLQQEYLWQWQHENGSSPSSQLSFPSFWDEEVDPETLVKIQQQYNAQLKQQEHEYYAYKQHLRNGAGTSQYLPVLGQHNQQPENEPLPPYLGIMSPLSAPLASLSLEPSTSSPRQQQLHQHQETPSSDELPYDTYLTHISDSPSFAPMQMDESGMGGSPLFSGTVGSILLEDINRALEVLPPPAYHRGSEELEEVMDLEMELEGFAGFQ